MGTIRAVFYILMISFSGGLFLYTIVAGGLTWIKASNAGILQFYKVFSKAYYWIYYLIVIVSLAVSAMNFVESYTCRNVIADSYEVGSQAFLAYENKQELLEITDEELYLSEKIPQYQKKAVQKQQNGFFYLFMSMLWFSLMINYTGFITREGYYPMCAQKPKKLVFRMNEKEIRFYTEYVPKQDKPLLTVENTEYNRKYYAALLGKEPKQ